MTCRAVNSVFDAQRHYVTVFMRTEVPADTEAKWVLQDHTMRNRKCSNASARHAAAGLRGALTRTRHMAALCRLTEPDKCDGWHWIPYSQLASFAEPLFMPLKALLESKYKL